MKLKFYLKDGTEKRAIVAYEPRHHDVMGVVADGNLYTNCDEFLKKYNYASLVTSNAEVREWLDRKGFIVRDSERTKDMKHIMLPTWMIAELDSLCRTKFFNFSRSDLINYILHKGFDYIPPEAIYEKNMRKTTFTLNPVVEQHLDDMCERTGRTRNHLIFDYITEYLINEDD